MALRVSIEEKARILELMGAGASDKEISDKICREFDRDTLDRSTIRRIRQKMALSPTMRMPVTATQQGPWERCQIRSERFPEGDHSWMIGDWTTDSFSVEQLEELPKGEMFKDSEGWATVIRTCWFCSFTKERREWGPILVVVE